jgi:elongation factor P--(R)-beta-lysine ligase
VTKPTPWWDARLHADRRPLLLARGRIKDAIRQYFRDRDFVEVECGALQVSPGNEAHLHAFTTTRVDPDLRKIPLYLHTSPEFACKKLLAAGEKRIYTLAPVYRNQERGALHAPEFQMLEWYRAEEPYDAVIEDSLAMVRLAAEAAGATSFRFRNRVADPFAAPERITVGDAFAKHADVNLLATLKPDGGTDGDALRRLAEAAGIPAAEDDSWSDIFSRLLVAKVEPKLGLGHPTVLDRYPRSEAALARAAPDDPRVSERFELYMCGVELANGFGELTDAVEQRKRFEAEMAEKKRVHGERYPIDEDFLAALAHMPQASGVALGFDRLVMLATGAQRIDLAMWTPPVGD